MDPALSAPHQAVLLVEEDVATRLGLAEYLRACGFRVIEAATLREAQTILDSGTPIEFVLLDAQLGGEAGGFELAQWLRTHRPGVGVLLTGGAASKAQAAAGLCESAHTPPFGLGELKAKIETLRSRLVQGHGTRPKRGSDDTSGKRKQR